MADLGIGPWGEEPTFHAPAFVVTHRPAETVFKQGGTSYIYVTQGIKDALRQAREAAGSQDVLINGGTHIARKYLRAGDSQLRNSACISCQLSWVLAPVTSTRRRSRSGCGPSRSPTRHWRPISPTNSRPPAEGNRARVRPADGSCIEDRPVNGGPGMHGRLNAIADWVLGHDWRRCESGACTPRQWAALFCMADRFCRLGTCAADG